MARQINYYEILGVSREASQTEIRNAYRTLAKQRHPDHPGGSADDFSLLQEAHATLSDPNRRRHHDEALDLAFAADQLADLDFDSLGDELSAKRRERESSGPSFGERLRGRFGRKEEDPFEQLRRETRESGRSSGRESGRRGRGRYREERAARWYEPHDFDPEPIGWKTGAISFVAAFLAFIAVGQIGLWAINPASAGSLAGISVLASFMPILYTLVGLVASYFAYRAAGYGAVGLVFVAALVVGGRGGPTGLLQFGTLGIVLLLVVIWLGKRRDRPGR
ncbi:MAG TPA: DnaJ domain-containing protein [Rubrobacteraceae bacterium]|nr:DnaJ domain-containing protein [Rubrobacteraceae bacterium]